MPSPAGPAADLEPEVRAQIVHHARQLRRSKWFRREESVDLEAELIVAWLRAVPRFDLQRAGLATFADRVLCNAVRMLIRERSAQKRGPAVPHSLDSPIEGSDGEKLTAAAILTPSDAMRRLGMVERPAPEVVQRAVRDAVAELPPEQQAACCQMMADGEAESGYSRAQIQRFKQLIRKRFEGNDLERYL